MKASPQTNKDHNADFALMRGEYLSLMEFADYQLSVLITESLGITRHSQEFQDWLVGTGVPLPRKIDLFNMMFKDHPQLNRFRTLLRALQSLWDVAAVFADSSHTVSTTARPIGKAVPATALSPEELKSRLGELREIEDVLAYMLACVQRGSPPSISADDFVDSAF